MEKYSFNSNETNLKKEADNNYNWQRKKERNTSQLGLINDVLYRFGVAFICFVEWMSSF